MRVRPAIELASTVTLLAAAVVAADGCSQPPGEEIVATAPSVVENPVLRIRLAGLPADFTVARNDGSELILEHADPVIEGRIDFTASPPEEGQNLPSAVKFHQAFIENQEAGDYQGGQELISPLGTAFYSRGRFTLEGESIEETVIFTLHPDADRMLKLRYRYPSGVDSSIRVQQLFDVLASVEGLQPKVSR